MEPRTAPATVTVSRRWYVVLPLVAAVTVIGLIIGSRIERRYRAEASVVFLAPEARTVQGERRSPDNPYDIRSVGGAVYRQLSDAQLEATLREEGYPTDYRVRLDRDVSIIDLDVTADDPDDAVAGAERLVDEARADLLRLQQAAGVEDDATIRLLPVVLSSDADAVGGRQTDVMVTAGLVGLVAGVVSALALGRRRRPLPPPGLVPTATDRASEQTPTPWNDPSPSVWPSGEAVRRQRVGAAQRRAERATARADAADVPSTASGSAPVGGPGEADRGAAPSGDPSGVHGPGTPTAESGDGDQPGGDPPEPAGLSGVASRPRRSIIDLTDGSDAALDAPLEARPPSPAGRRPTSAAAELPRQQIRVSGSAVRRARRSPTAASGLAPEDSLFAPDPDVFVDDGDDGADRDPGAPPSSGTAEAPDAPHGSQHETP